MPVHLMQADDRLTVTDDALGVQGGDKDTSYTLRPLTRETYREIIQRHTKKVPNRRTHQMDEVTDHPAAGDDLLDYAVVAWSGILLGGAEAPCTRENKLKLDLPRASALLDKAGLGEVTSFGAAERRAESFRGPA